MMTNMDYCKVSELLEDFFQLTHIRISFWDTHGKKCAAGPVEGDSEFCRTLRKNQAFDAQCVNCDQEALLCAAKNPNQLHCFQCGAGLNEYVYPAVYDQVLLGFFMFGQVRHINIGDNGSALRQRIYRYYGLDVVKMQKLYFDLPPVTTEMMASAGRMLSALASYAYLNGLVKLQRMPLAERIDRYIKEHCTEDISIESVCKELCISRSALSHTIQSSFSDTFVKMVNRYRIEHVKQSLHKGKGIAEAAYLAGYHSENYLSRLFRRSVGMTPQQYRRSVGDG